MLNFAKMYYPDMPNKCDNTDTKLQRTRQPPDELIKTLDLVNALPPDAVKDLGIRNDIRRRMALGYQSIEMEFRRAFENYIAQLLSPLQEFIGPLYNPDNPNAYEEAKWRYANLVDARDFLRRIAEINDGIWNKFRSYDEQAMLEYWRTRGIEALFYSRLTVVTWSLNDEGCLVPKLTSWIDDLKKDLEVIRIRLCPACNRIFWAGRIDKSTCSEKKCGQVWRKRLSREAWGRHGEQYRRASKKKVKSTKDSQTRLEKQKGD